MDKKEHEEYIKNRNRKIKKSGNRFLITFIVVFFAGYLFFFTSNLWMPADYIGVAATEHGETISSNDRDVTLISWVYCKEERKMEVLLDIDNMALDGIDRYEWSTVDAKKGIVKTEVVAESDDFVVLHIVNVPRRWAEISLRMDIPNDVMMAENIKWNTLKFYAVRDTIDNAAHIEEKSMGEYRKAAIRQVIADNENRIAQIEEENRELLKTKAEAEKKQKSLESDKKYQTAEDLIKTDQSIAQMQVEIDNCKDQIESNNKEIAECEERILLQKKKLAKIGG